MSARNSALHPRLSYHVLGKALAQAEIVALLDEVTEGKGVLVGVAAGKALVGHVKEGEELLLLEDVRELLPLLRRGVNASRVVCASMQEDDALCRRVLDTK